MRPSRLPVAALLAATILYCLATPASAQTAPAAAPPTPANPPTATAMPPGTPPAARVDPVVAKVGDQEIRLSDLSAAAQNLPEQFRGMPPQALYPMLLEQMIDRQAMAIYARKQGLDQQPAVQHAVQQAVDQTLTTALLQRDVGPSLTEPAIQAIYERDYAHKPGEIEVHARHILVATEDEANKVIAQLKGGADFETLAKQVSTEPGAKQSGGDLGYFKKGDMVPEFAAAAFAMKPGEYSQTPVHSQFGWHVIQVLDVRQAAPQTLEQVHDQIRQQLIQDGVQKVQQQAMAGLAVQRFNPDGTPQRATDTAQPPAPAAKP